MGKYDDILSANPPVSSKHPRMDISNRAKQFAPFAALTGHEEAIRAKEKILAEKIELSEDAMEEMDRTLREISPGMLVTAVYFHKGEYLEVTGMISKVDATGRILQIVENRIPFGDLLKVEIP